MTISTQELTNTLKASRTVDEAANMLGVSRRMLGRLCAEYGMDPPGHCLAISWPKWERSFASQWTRVFGDDVRYEDEPGTASRGVAIFLNPKSFHPPMGLNAALRSVTW